MGCDIHYVIEKKFDDAWVGVYATRSTPNPALATETEYGSSHVYDRDQAFERRDYTFFAMLAGVRGDGPEPLGVPDNASQLTQVLVREWEDNGHSHSHCSYREWCEKYALARAWAFVNEGNLDWLAGKDTHDLDDYRVVFWFDN